MERQCIAHELLLDDGKRLAHQAGRDEPESQPVPLITEGMRRSGLGEGHEVRAGTALPAPRQQLQLFAGGAAPPPAE